MLFFPFGYMSEILYNKYLLRFNISLHLSQHPKSVLFRVSMQSREPQTGHV